MVREWDNGGQKRGRERPKEPRAQERKTAPGKSKKNGIPGRAPSPGGAFQDQDSLCCQRDRWSPSPLGTWAKCDASDPRVALGKYSPLEKEILHLGGVHTIASRRLLALKQEEEQKMLKELQLPADYKKVMEYKEQRSAACPTCRPREKIWTAKVVVPPRELKLPCRERLDFSKHVERMQFARALRNSHLSPAANTPRSSAALCLAARDSARGDQDKDGNGGCDGPTREERYGKTTEGQEIKMNVIFKAEGPPKCLSQNPRDLEPFFPGKKVERSVAGLTNRNLFHLAEFPGDLMLMNQDFIARGFHSRDGMKAACLGAVGVCRESMGEPASLHY